MLTEVTTVGELKRDENFNIFIRLDKRVFRDGECIAGPNYWRGSYPPGSDVSEAHPDVQSFAALIWTPEVLAEAAARQAALNPEP